MNLLLEGFEWQGEKKQTHEERLKTAKKKRKTHGAGKKEGPGSGKA